VLAVFPAIVPGLRVQSPAGKPLRTTLPVDVEQVVCVTELITGAEGVTGCGSIIMLGVAGEIHPEALVTVYVFVPGVIPVRVVVTPVPAMAPGSIVQFPRGKPLKATLPVAKVQVGCVMVPVTGADGVNGCVFITIFTDAAEVHPAALVTV
jgi:hypothetical protein